MSDSWFDRNALECIESSSRVNAWKWFKIGTDDAGEDKMMQGSVVQRTEHYVS